MSAGLRVDLMEIRFTDGFTGRWRWRLWSNSRIIGASTEGYNRRSRAIANLESVTGGQFEKVSTPDHPEPFGLLQRCLWHDGIHDHFDRIPVRLVES